MPTSSPPTRGSLRVATARSGTESLRSVVRQNTNRTNTNRSSARLEETEPGIVTMPAKTLAPKPKSPKKKHLDPPPPATPIETPPETPHARVHPFEVESAEQSSDDLNSTWHSNLESIDEHTSAVKWAARRHEINRNEQSQSDIDRMHRRHSTLSQSFVSMVHGSTKYGSSKVHTNAQAVQRLWWSGCLESVPNSVFTWMGAFCIFFVPFLANFFWVEFFQNGSHSSVQRIAGRFVSEIRHDVGPGWNRKDLQSELDTARDEAASFVSIAEGRECVERWTVYFQEELQTNNRTTSDPAVVNTFVQRLFGKDWWPVQERLEGILSNETDLVEFVGSVGSCAAHNVVLGRLACEAWNKPGARLTFATDANYAQVLQELATYMLTLETLTADAVADAAFAATMVAELNRRFDDMDLLEKGLYEDGATADAGYERDKYQAARAGMEAMVDWVRARAVEPKVLEGYLQLNVLEGALEDLEAGMEKSGVVGVTLASQVEGRGRYATITEDASLTMSLPLGREWVQTFLAWHAVFLSGQSTAVPERTGLRLAKLFIPSVACSVESTGASSFVLARAISLFVDLNYAGYGDGPGLFDADGTDGNVTVAWSDVVYRSLPFQIAGKGNVSDVGHSLQRVFRPTGWSLFSYIATNDMQLVSALSLLAGCLLAAMALESIMSLIVLPLLKQDTANSAAWMTEMIYSLFVMVSLYAQSPWGIPFMLIGTWRAGIPECLSGFFAAIDPLAPNTLLQRVHIFIRSVSMGLHHTCTAFVVCSISIGYSILNRDILAVCLPMAYEHLAAPLRYQSAWGYRILVALLEVWWQFEAYYFLSNDNLFHEKIALVVMLAAHYCIIISDALDGFKELHLARAVTSSSVGSDDVDDVQDVDARPAPRRK